MILNEIFSVCYHRQSWVLRNNTFSRWSLTRSSQSFPANDSFSRLYVDFPLWSGGNSWKSQTVKMEGFLSARNGGQYAEKTVLWNASLQVLSSKLSSGGLGNNRVDLILPLPGTCWADCFVFTIAILGKYGNSRNWTDNQPVFRTFLFGLLARDADAILFFKGFREKRRGYYMRQSRRNTPRNTSRNTFVMRILLCHQSKFNFLWTNYCTDLGHEISIAKGDWATKWDHRNWKRHKRC